MTNKLISNVSKDFIFGNDAVVRGALESGVGFISSYPGCPVSEIADTFSGISKDSGIYFEYSTNEKIALEAAAGAAFSGVKSLVIMKHYGLNVALDSLLPLIYLECPMVVVVADDPGSFSSVQAEEDTRFISYLGHLPTLVPSNPQEALDMTKEAFKIAWKNKIPVMIRLTIRVSYSRSEVDFGTISEIKKQGEFLKDPEGFKLGSGQTIKLHEKAISKIEKIQKEISEQKSLNFIEGGEGELGIVTSGVSYEYVKEILNEMNLKLPILKIGMTYPFPVKLAEKFISQYNKMLVIEELDPIIENELRKIKNDTEIIGKELIPEAGELGPEDVEIALTKLLDLKISKNLEDNVNQLNPEKIPTRLPSWCLGCPHRETFKAVKQALGEDVIFGGDIGCYMIGAYPPAKMLDFVVAMGAGIGITHGIAKTNKKKPVVFIGDSTFFHAGIPALINLVFNKSDVLMIVLDNRCTAMTGHQPHPGTGLTGEGEKTKELKIEEIAQSCGADNIEIINVYNLDDSVKKIKEVYNKPGVSVIIAKGECVLYKKKRLKNERKK